MTKIFWGLMLNFLTFNINGIDILPDFLGYILIVIGLTQLADQSNHFCKAKPLAMIMVFVAFMMQFSPLFGFMNYGILFYAISISTALVRLYVVYLIVLGIKDIETIFLTELNANKLMSMWKIKSVLEISGLILFFMPLELIVIMLVILAFIANIVFLVYFYHAQTLYQTL